MSFQKLIQRERIKWIIALKKQAKVLHLELKGINIQSTIIIIATTIMIVTIIVTQAKLLFLGLKGINIQSTCYQDCDCSGSHDTSNAVIFRTERRQHPAYKTTRFAIVLSIIRKPIAWQIITRMVTGEDITCKSWKKSCMSKGSMSVYCHNGQ